MTRKESDILTARAQREFVDLTGYLVVHSGGVLGRTAWPAGGRRVIGIVVQSRSGNSLAGVTQVLIQWHDFAEWRVVSPMFYFVQPQG